MSLTSGGIRRLLRHLRQAEAIEEKFSAVVEGSRGQEEPTLGVVDPVPLIGGGGGGG